MKSVAERTREIGLLVHYVLDFSACSGKGDQRDQDVAEWEHERDVEPDRIARLKPLQRAHFMSLFEGAVDEPGAVAALSLIDCSSSRRRSSCVTCKPWWRSEPSTTRPLSFRCRSI